MKKNLRVAAVDYGTKRIGLAITDATGMIAYPFGVVPSGRNLQEAVQNVLEALLPHLPEIRLLVVGLPLLLKGTLGEMAAEVQRFAALLREQSGKEVELLDERLSSRAVERIQLELGQKRKERKETSDEMAATLLLQTFTFRYS